MSGELVVNTVYTIAGFIQAKTDDRHQATNDQQSPAHTPYGYGFVLEMIDPPSIECDWWYSAGLSDTKVDYGNDTKVSYGNLHRGLQE